MSPVAVMVARMGTAPEPSSMSHKRQPRHGPVSVLPTFLDVPAAAPNQITASMLGPHPATAIAVRGTEIRTRIAMMAAAEMATGMATGVATGRAPRRSMGRAMGVMWTYQNVENHNTNKGAATFISRIGNTS